MVEFPCECPGRHDDALLTPHSFYLSPGTPSSRAGPRTGRCFQTTPAAPSHRAQVRVTTRGAWLGAIRERLMGQTELIPMFAKVARQSATARPRHVNHHANASVGASVDKAIQAICPWPRGMMPPPGVASTIPPRMSSSRIGHSMRPLPRRSPMNSW